MSSEIQVTAELQYTNTANNIAAKSLSVLGSLFNITGKNYAQGGLLVPTTAGGTALPISNLATLGWAFFKNNDATNYVDIMTAVSGTAFARIKPGECAVFRFAAGITAPAVLANTAGVEIEYLILES
jgi:hypothetical protein